MNISEKIQEILDWYGMEQKELAKRINIPYSTLNGCLKNNRSVPAEYILKIADVLNISVLILLDSNPLPINSIEITNRESLLISNYRFLNKEQQKFIEQSINLFIQENTNNLEINK